MDKTQKDLYLEAHNAAVESLPTTVSLEVEKFAQTKFEAAGYAAENWPQFKRYFNQARQTLTSLARQKVIVPKA